MDQKGTKVMSPTLHRVVSRRRDLSQYLEEEKRQSKSTKAGTPQFSHTRSNSAATAGDGIAFVPFEGHFVTIDDQDGFHCPIYKEYSKQPVSQDGSNPFKVPRMAYPTFYWDAPMGQCPFIPPLAHVTAADAQNQPPPAMRRPTHHRSSQAAKENRPLGDLTAQAPADKDGLVEQQVPGLTGSLRARQLRHSTVQSRATIIPGQLLAETSLQRRPTAGPSRLGPDIVFEPAMTDTSILTAKTNLTRRPGGVAPQPPVKLPPNISINVNRTGSTPRHLSAVSVTGPVQTRKSSPAMNGHLAAAQDEPARRSGTRAALAAERAKTVHRARPGFCECCCEKYSELEKHVKTSFHRQFALQSDNYEGIDAFIGALKRTIRPEYLISAYKATAVGPNGDPLPPKSPISPSPSTTNTSVVTVPRNYRSNKKMKQSLVTNRLNMRTTSSCRSSSLDEEDAAAGSGTGSTAVQALLSSPSCKRRRSHRIAQ